MKRLLFIIFIILYHVPIFSQNIVRGEYFFDTDPGFGNGTPILFSYNDTIENNIFIPINQINDGMHILYLRYKNENNLWGITTNRIFIKSSNVNAVNQFEYFFNNDPGIGNGNLVTITGGEGTFLADVSALPNGVNVIYVRAKNPANNTVGIAVPKIFYKGTFPANTFSVGYYFDTIPPANNIIEVPVVDSIAHFFADISHLSNGIHVLYVRANGIAGSLSGSPVSHLFYKTQIPASIQKLEYFFDSDPGYGNGYTVNVTGENTTFFANVEQLSEGSHTIFIRAYGNGVWGKPQQYFFCKSKRIGIRPNIIAGESFLDNEIGVGNGLQYSLMPGSINIDTTFYSPLPSASVGWHKYYTRLKDQKDIYGMQTADSIVFCQYPITNEREIFYANENCTAILPDYTQNVIDAICFASGTTTVAQTPIAGTVISGLNNLITINIANSGKQINYTFYADVIDTIAPVIYGNLTDTTIYIYLDDNCEAILPDFSSLVNVYDNCTNSFIIEQTPSPTTPLIAGNYTVGMTVKDESNNSSFIDFNVVVLDSIKPQIQCAISQDIYLEDGINTYIVNGNEFDPVSISDNCTVLSLINNYNNTNTMANEVLLIGNHIFHWTITDNAGNQNECFSQVNIYPYTNVLVYPANEDRSINIFTKDNQIFIQNKAYIIEKLELFDFTGKKLISKTPKDLNTIINLQQISAGIYFLMIQSNGENIFYKILVR